ncbi:MAG: hypothetical protein Q4G33_09235 [bacterium]|nr:hypothetical protein [bacterium]
MKLKKIISAIAGVSVTVVIISIMNVTANAAEVSLSTSSEINGALIYNGKAGGNKADYYMDDTSKTLLANAG